MTDKRKSPPSCPVCVVHSREDVIAAEGIVLAAAEALAYGRKADIVTLFEAAEPYDFHIAVTMYVEALDVLAQYACVDFFELLQMQRKEFNATLAQDAGSATDPGGSNPP
jgi:hypothetical protein